MWVACEQQQVMCEPLGVGGATTFAMGSYHHTALNHAFRDESGFNPRLQVKMKCNYCGCWTTKGKPCYFCRQRNTTKPMMTPRDNSVSVPAPPERARSASKNRAQTPRAHSPPRAESHPKEHVPSNVRRSTTPAPSTANTKRLALNGTIIHSGPSNYSNALGHKFRDESAYIPSQNSKIKCRSCGCWVTKTKPCALCRTITS